MPWSRSAHQVVPGSRTLWAFGAFWSSKTFWRSGPSGQSGEPGLNTISAERRDGVQITHALLLFTLGKLEGPEAVDDCRRHCEAQFWTHSDGPSHRHGELDPDLTSTSLYLLDAVVKKPCCCDACKMLAGLPAVQL